MPKRVSCRSRPPAAPARAPPGPPGKVSPAPLFGSGISHLAQYLAEAGFSAPHFEQAFIIGSLYQQRVPQERI
jgi:hypothetical protein